MPHRDLLLKALNCQISSSKRLNEPQQFAILVLWLENTKIRQYPVDDRKMLSQTSNSAWLDCYRKYLQDVQCPLSLEDDNKVQTLDWLLNYAVSLEFQDQADSYNKSAARKPTQPTQSSKLQASAALHTDIDSDETKQMVNALLKQLKLPADAIEQSEQLQMAKNLVADVLLPALEDSELSKAAREAASQLSHLDVHKFPLGFTTGDSKTDIAATILRMLYIRDLRILQSTIDQTLVEVQNYTANPKTDAALGRIGR